MKRRQTFLFSLALLAGSALAATDAQSPQGLLKGQVPDNLPALKRVAITSFMVQYVTDQGIETKRKSGGSFFSKWKAVTPELMQGATSALYAQMVEDLKAAGVDVVPVQEVLAQPVMADIRKVAKPNPMRADDSSLMKVSQIFSAQDLPITFATVQDAKLDTYFTKPLDGTDSPSNLIGWDKQSKQWLSGTHVEISSLATLFLGYAKVAETLNATALNVRLVVPLVDMGVTTAGNAGGGFFGAAKITGLIKPNPRIVEAGTVFSLAPAGGNPGHRFVLALQKPVTIAGMKVSADPEKVSLDDTIFGKSSARGSGLFGALTRATGATAEEADFWVSVEADTFQPSLLAAGSTIFKDLAQLLSNPK